MPPEKLSFAKRDANHTHLPERIANSWLPAIQGSPKNMRSFDRPRKSASSKNDEPFNYHDLLEEVGHNKLDAPAWPRLPDISDSSLKPLNSSAEIPDGRRCADCVQLAESQREIAASLQAASNVIESLERSVRLLQTKLALYEGDMRAVKQAISRLNQDELSLSIQKGKTKSHFATLRGNEVDPSANSNSVEHELVSAKERARSIIAVPSNVQPYEAADQTAFGQADNQTRNEIDPSLTEFKAEIKMLATVLVVHDEQIERLKTANMMLAKHNDALTRDTQAIEKAQRRTQEAVQNHTKAVGLLISELETDRSAAKHDIAKRFYTRRHER